MKYGSLFSGIEAASVAWHSLGWEPQFFSEIESFPCSVLAERFPSVPNHGDVTKFKEWPDHAIDLLVGGSPCQSFSIAGLRKGLDDPRGNLMLTYLAVVARYRPKWMVWENVPGVLSSDGGRDFGTFLGALGKLGYGFAYRVLDAQFTRAREFPHAVPQRRRRVFVIGHLGDWRPAAAVLFDSESLRGDSPPRREARKVVAPTIDTGTRGYGDFELNGGLTAQVTGALNSAGGHAYPGQTVQDASVGMLIPEISNALAARDYKQPRAEDGVGLIPISFGAQMSEPQVDIGVNQTLQAKNPMAVTYPINTQIAMRHEALGEGTGLGIGSEIDPSFTLQAGHSHAVGVGMAVRRLTPTECERLQGFPDGWTNVTHRGKPAADGPRYKALGNSMAVNVMQWIGERIELVQEQI